MGSKRVNGSALLAVGVVVASLGPPRPVEAVGWPEGILIAASANRPPPRPQVPVDPGGRWAGRQVGKQGAVQIELEIVADGRKVSGTIASQGTSSFERAPGSGPGPVTAPIPFTGSINPKGEVEFQLPADAPAPFAGARYQLRRTDRALLGAVEQGGERRGLQLDYRAPAARASSTASSPAGQAGTGSQWPALLTLPDGLQLALFREAERSALYVNTSGYVSRLAILHSGPADRPLLMTPPSGGQPGLLQDDRELLQAAEADLFNFGDRQPRPRRGNPVRVFSVDLFRQGHAMPVCSGQLHWSGRFLFDRQFASHGCEAAAVAGAAGSAGGGGSEASAAASPFQSCRAGFESARDATAYASIKGICMRTSVSSHVAAERLEASLYLARIAESGLDGKRNLNSAWHLYSAFAERDPRFREGLTRVDAQRRALAQRWVAAGDAEMAAGRTKDALDRYHSAATLGNAPIALKVARQIETGASSVRPLEKHLAARDWYQLAAANGSKEAASWVDREFKARQVRAAADQKHKAQVCRDTPYTETVNLRTGRVVGATIAEKRDACLARLTDIDDEGHRIVAEMKAIRDRQSGAMISAEPPALP